MALLRKNTKVNSKCQKKLLSKCLSEQHTLPHDRLLKYFFLTRIKNALVLFAIHSTRIHLKHN